MNLITPPTPTSPNIDNPDQPLRVCLVTETFEPEVNGVAMTLGRLVSGLRTRGHTVQLVRPSQRGPATVDQQPQDFLTPGFPIPGYGHLRFGMPCKSRLLTLWGQARPDVVHVATEGPLGWSAVATARQLGVPVTSSFHTNFEAYSGHYSIGFLKSTIDAYLRHLHNQTRVTLAPTLDQARALSERGYLRTAVLGRGVDTRQFAAHKRSQSLRASWGLNETDLAVIHVGRLAKEKNLGLVLSTFGAIQQRVPRARLILVGDGPLFAATKASHPQVVMAGVQRGQDLAAHYASGDMFLFPSVTETYGNVVPEALASELAVVSYEHAAAATLIRHGHNGLLAPLNDAAKFADAALRVATDAPLRNSLRQAAHESVAHLGWPAVCEGFAAVLRRAACGDLQQSAPPTFTAGYQPSA